MDRPIRSNAPAGALPQRPSPPRDARGLAPNRRELDRLVSSHSSLIVKLEESAASLKDALRLASEIRTDGGLAERSSSDVIRDVVRGLSPLIRQVENVREAARQEAANGVKEHEVLEAKLDECLGFLNSAVAISADLQRSARSGASADIRAERRLRLKDVVQTIGAARHHVAKVRTISSTLSDALKEAVNDLSNGARSAFE